jgi:hypothetical protein
MLHIMRHADVYIQMLDVMTDDVVHYTMSDSNSHSVPRMLQVHGMSVCMLHVSACYSLHVACYCMLEFACYCTLEFARCTLLHVTGCMLHVADYKLHVASYSIACCTLRIRMMIWHPTYIFIRMMHLISLCP